MEHQRRQQRKDVRQGNEGLPDNHPVFEARFNQRPFGLDLCEAVKIERTRINRISDFDDVVRRQPVAVNGNAGGVDKPLCLRSAGFFDGPDDVQHAAEVGFIGFPDAFETARRNEGGHVENQIRLFHAKSDVFVIFDGSPMNIETGNGVKRF